MAARRSGSITTLWRELRAARPATISSMIASGSSVRGLSEVMTARSASRAPMPPMSGRLPRSRSPPQPNTTSTRPSVTARAALQRVLERVRRVRVVDDDAERLAGAHRLEAAGDALGDGEAARARPRRGSPRARPAAAAASGVLDVEARREAQRHALVQPEARADEREGRAVGAQIEVAGDDGGAGARPSSSTAQVHRSSP